MRQTLRLIPDRKTETPLRQALQAYLLDCHAKNLSRGTIQWYEGKISSLLCFLEEKTSLPDCTASMLNEESVRLFIWRAKEKENPRTKGAPLSSATVKGTVVALKVFLKFLHEEGYVKENFALKIKTPRVRKKIIETLSSEQIQSILSSPDKEVFTGFRDYCMLLTFLDTGVRLSELIHLEIRRIDFLSGTLRVLGKGDKERRVPFGAGLKKALEKYIRWRGDKPEHDFLFVNQYGEKMKARCIQEMLVSCGKRAGITGVRMSPHTLRHTFAKMMILNGMDALTLQYILGHTSLDMVRQYVNLTGEDVALRRNRVSLIDRMGIQEPTKKKKLW